MEVNLQDYWRDRFQADAETWARSQKPADAAKVGAEVGATVLSLFAHAGRP